MARLPRIDVPGIAQHVVTRGNDRQACFFSDDDFATYRAWLFEAAQRHVCALHAFALMTNHVHLLMTGRVPGAIGATMQATGRRYVRHINGRYRRTGTPFEGRYKASLVHTQKDCVLGSPRFQAQLVRMIGRRTALPAMGRPARPA